MLSYRITKYNPKFRDDKGAYQKNEWISISEIGKKFDDIELTVDAYVRSENSYINAIHSFMNALNIKSLTVSGLENRYRLTENDRRYPELYSGRMIATARSVKDGDNLVGIELDNFCRLSLRNQLWGILENDSQMFFHFGYDYYMYIGAANTPESVIKQIDGSGLFIEEFESPHLK
jgi:hypothetical protein